MTIKNEAARLFFAISALILVGMLSAPTGGNFGRPPQDITPKVAPKRLAQAEKKSQSKRKNNLIKITDKKRARKIVMK